MSDETWDVAEASERAWVEFETLLEEYVEAVPAEAILTLDVPVAEQPDDGCAPWVQVLVDTDRVMVQVVSNEFLAPAYALSLAQEQQLFAWGFARPGTTIDFPMNGEDECSGWALVELDPVCAEIPASAAVEVLRQVFGVIDPALLQIEGAGDEGAWHALVSIGPPEEDDGRPDLPIARAADQAGLRELIGTVLAEWSDPVEVDDDGDHRFVHDGVPVYVRALGNEPTVEIFTRLAGGVRSRPQAAIELALLNREFAKVKFQLFDRDVFQVLALPAMPFVGEHLWSALEEFLVVAQKVRPDLTLRVGGRA
jgi:hypothetical protein